MVKVYVGLGFEVFKAKVSFWSVFWRSKNLKGLPTTTRPFETPGKGAFCKSLRFPQVFLVLQKRPAIFPPSNALISGALGIPPRPKHPLSATNPSLQAKQKSWSIAKPSEVPGEKIRQRRKNCLGWFQKVV